MEDIKKDIQNKAIELIRAEKALWDTESAFVTPKVSFEMRNVIERARKNYFGIFDEPVDSATGLEKIWVPLTEWSVETVVKNTDLDTKDISIRATKPAARRFVHLVRSIVKNFLKKLTFGDILNDGIRNLAIDGTWVQKSYKGFSPQEKKEILRTRRVDLLNIWMDPAAESIQAAHGIIERAIMTEDDLKGYKSVWINTGDIEYKTDFLTIYDNYTYKRREVPAIDVYERHGKMPLYFITGKEKDKNKWVDGVIVVSGLNSGTPLVHKIITNPKGIKPYEEAWLRRVPGRWYGRGVPEQLFGLQRYLNEIVNTRRNTNLLVQNRLFEVRNGSGINQQQIARLVAGGIIKVSKIGEDIKEFPVSDQRQSSYADEERIYSMSEKVSGAFEVARGETLPASLPATSAVLQNQSSKSGFSLIQEGVGLFIKRVIETHWIPMIFDLLKDEEIIELAEDAGDIKAFDEIVIEELLNNSMLRYLEKTGFIPEEFEIENERARLRQELVQMGKTRFVQLRKKAINMSEYAVDVYVTDEDFDKGIMVQNLRELLMVYAKIAQANGSSLDVDEIMREVLDVMGLGSERFFSRTGRQTALPQQQMFPQFQPPLTQAETPVGKFQAANFNQ